MVAGKVGRVGLVVAVLVEVVQKSEQDIARKLQTTVMDPLPKLWVVIHNLAQVS